MNQNSFKMLLQPTKLEKISKFKLGKSDTYLNATRVDSRGQDTMDAVAGFGEGAPESVPGSSAVRPSGNDDIDGRGSFEARELERELRRMRRGDLQVNSGVLLGAQARLY